MILSWLALAAVSQPPAEPVEPPPEEAITVTGKRRAPAGFRGTEQPYSEVERVPLGSRIARRVAERPFRTVATDSGVAGMLQGSGMDGTGGLSHGTRSRRVRECVADDRQVRPHVACIVFRVERQLSEGEPAAAREALLAAMDSNGLSEGELFYLGHVAHRVSAAIGDDRLRQRSLQLLIASGRLSSADRRLAERAVAQLAPGTP